MEIYHLFAFVKVAKEGNLTHAAEKIHISPSALSTQIKTLEEELGIVLFRRQARGMRLTTQGETLLPSAVAALDAIQEFKTKATLIDPYTNATLRIGMNASPEFLQMSAINAAFFEKIPGLSLQFVTSDSTVTDRMLKDGMIDMGFVFVKNRGSNSPGGIVIKILASVDMRVVIPRKFIQKDRELSWEAIVQLPWVWGDKNAACHIAFKDQLSQRRLTLNTATYAMDDTIIKELVKDGRGLALMRCVEAEKIASNGNVVIWPRGKVTVSLGLAYLKENRNDALIAAACKIIFGLWGQVNNP